MTHTVYIYIYIHTVFPCRDFTRTTVYSSVTAVGYLFKCGTYHWMVVSNYIKGIPVKPTQSRATVELGQKLIRMFQS